MVEDFPLHFIMATLVSSVGVLFIMLMKKVFGKHISARWRYNLDLLYLVLFLAPFLPSGFFGAAKMESWLNPQKIVESITVSHGGSDMTYGMGWLQDFTLSVNRYDFEYLPVIFISIWVIGIIVLSIITLSCNKNLRLLKESMKRVEDTERLLLFSDCKASAGVKREIFLGTSILIKSPVTVGVFRTRIILPVEKIPPADLRYALLHELLHCKYMDNLIGSLMCLFQIIYWFNPAVYFALKEMRLDREVACDTSVLKTLPDDSYISYGKSLLSFISTTQRPKMLSLSTEIGGSKQQTAKRIKQIALFTGESKSLRVKSVCAFVLAGTLILSQIPTITVLAAYNGGKFNFRSENVQYEDLSTFFNGFEGSFVLYDIESDLYSIYNQEKSVTRVSPASTYKIYSALIAMETGVIDRLDSIREWDGTEYPYEVWNKDHYLTSALQNSVSWYFQKIDTETGIKELGSYLTQLSYGNENTSGGIADFWMESSLLISPVEQVNLLKDIYQNKSIFKEENVNTLKDILRLTEQDGAVLSGKTGTGSVNGKVINGWFIGYVEKNGHAFIFATNIQGDDNAGGSAAVQITLSILKEKDIY